MFCSTVRPSSTLVDSRDGAEAAQLERHGGSRPAEGSVSTYPPVCVGGRAQLALEHGRGRRDAHARTGSRPDRAPFRGWCRSEPPARYSRSADQAQSARHREAREACRLKTFMRDARADSLRDRFGQDS